MVQLYSPCNYQNTINTFLESVYSASRVNMGLPVQQTFFLERQLKLEWNEDCQHFTPASQRTPYMAKTWPQKELFQLVVDINSPKKSSK